NQVTDGEAGKASKIISNVRSWGTYTTDRSFVSVPAAAMNRSGDIVPGCTATNPGCGRNRQNSTELTNLARLAICFAAGINNARCHKGRAFLRFGGWSSVVSQSSTPSAP